jgi:hypothetical protein
MTAVTATWNHTLLYQCCATGTAGAVTVGAGIFSVVVAVAITFEIEMAVAVSKGGMVARLILLDVSAGVRSVEMVVQPVTAAIPGPVDVFDVKADTSVEA